MAGVIALRRFLVFQAFLFWQGGFVFYAAIVVPTGTEMLGSATQGLVTQRVTHWLNAFGILWHLLIFWDLRSHWSRLRFRLWIVSFVFLISLIGLHIAMDEALVNRGTHFRTMHILYLWISTFHWLIGLAMAWLSLRVWGQN